MTAPNPLHVLNLHRRYHRWRGACFRTSCTASSSSTATIPLSRFLQPKARLVLVDQRWDRWEGRHPLQGVVCRNSAALTHGRICPAAPRCGRAPSPVFCVSLGDRFSLQTRIMCAVSLSCLSPSGTPSKKKRNTKTGIDVFPMCVIESMTRVISERQTLPRAP